MPRSVLRIGTRSSALALAQAETVRQAIQQVITKRNFELVPVVGPADDADENAFVPLDMPGFLTGDIDEALAEGKIDLAVHSATDLAPAPPTGVVLAAVPPRIDPREALLTRAGVGLHALQPGTRVGTSSRRRAAQIRALGRGLVPVPMRGHVDVRLRRLTAGDVDALVVSVAGLKRLQKDHRITEILPLDFMLPAPGQGSLAVECRAGDKDMRAALAQIEDPLSRRTFDAERAFLLALGGDVAAPVSALAKLDRAMVKLRVMVAAEDGSRLMREVDSGDDAEKLGVALAERMIDAGARELL